MLANFKTKGFEADNLAGCVICQGGNPTKTENEAFAHHGAPDAGEAELFYPISGRIWIVEKTCCQAGCHLRNPTRWNSHR
jgi:hypothetical protein